MKMSKKIAIVASILLISSCIGFTVSADTSKSGSCKKTETSYTDVLTSHDYDQTASLSIGYFYRNNTDKADMLCTYGYDDGGTKCAKIAYDGTTSLSHSEKNAATVQLSITKKTGNKIVYSGWQRVSTVADGNTGELQYTLTLTE